MTPKEIVKNCLSKICEDHNWPLPGKLVIDEPKNKDFGELATNIALHLSKIAKIKPIDIANEIAAQMQHCPYIRSAKAAAPGFINITLDPEIWQKAIIDIEEAKDKFGCANIGQGEKVMVEYVSANPTGPLHIGHGRGAAYGDSISRILKATGYDVTTEYYLNDAGEQMRKLGKSIILRAKELSGEKIKFPDEFYKGNYIIDIAQELLAEDPELLNKEDAEALAIAQKFGGDKILAEIRQDLEQFRCSHETWFSEKSLIDNGTIDKSLAALKASGRSFEADGALWFDAKSLGDSENRVLKKSDGNLTYFATDIAYHHNKFERGFKRLIDVWGADHHGYIPRMKAAITDMGEDPDKLDIVLIQLVSLLRNGKAVSMSTRAGTFDTLNEVVEQVGVDAARFMFLARSSDSPLDFDLELATRRSMDNPVYYVQYAYARICALERRALERNIISEQTINQKTDPELLKLLASPEELALLRQLSEYPEIVINASKNLAPHLITRYLMDLAGKLHTYYAKTQILVTESPALAKSRLALLKACGQVLQNGLQLLGVSAPDKM